MTDIKQAFITLGFSDQAIAKILRLTNLRDTKLLQQKLTAYQAILRIDQPTLVKLINKFPKMLDYDATSENPTAVKSKIKDFQAIFHTDEYTVTKMLVSSPSLLGCDSIGTGPTSIKTKIKDLQALLQTDEQTVAKMITTFPALLGCDINGNSPTSIANKLKFFQSTLSINDQALLQILTKSPVLLTLDTTSQGPTSLDTKIKKLSTIMPAKKMRECIAYNPAILTVPAQSFKVRYMLAENNGVMPTFLRSGFMTNQSKVWARACHLNRHQGVFNMRNVYTDERKFQQIFNINSTDLMQAHPLDQNAVTNIEHTYYLKTGHDLTLDQQERASIMKSE